MLCIFLIEWRAYAVNFLFSHRIVADTSLDFASVYDFVFDRLRAVRQDIVIQAIWNENTVYILESSIEFFLHSKNRFDILLNLI